MKLEKSLIVCAFGFVCGVAAGVFHGTWYPVLAWVWPLMLAACIGVAFAAWRRDRRGAHRGAWVVGLALFTLAAATGGTRAGAALQPAERGSLRKLLENRPIISKLTIRGRICREPEKSSTHSILLTVAVSESRLGTGAWHRVDGETIRISVLSRRKRAPGKTFAEERPDLASVTAYGDTLEAMVFRFPFKPKPGRRSFGAKQMQAYLRREGFAGHLMAHAKNVKIVESARGNPIVECALALKDRMGDVFRREFDEPVARLASGVVLGRKREAYAGSYRGKSMSELFAASGMSHILAVSGLHISLVAGTIFGLLRKLRLPRLLAAVAGSGTVWFYVLLTGASTAAVRAGVMNSVGMIFYGLGMKPLTKAALAGLCVAALASLLPNPLRIGSIGFQLSFGAVLVLILLAPRVDALLQGIGGGGLLGLGLWLAVALGMAARHMAFVATGPGFVMLAGLLAAGLWAGHRLDARHPALKRNGYKRLPALLRGLLATQIAIQVGLLLPLSGWYFQHFSVAGCLVNLIAIPFSGVTIQISLLCGLLGTLPGVGVWLAGWIGLVANTMGTAFLELAFHGAALFGYPAVARPSPVLIVIYYALLAATAWVLGSRWRGPRLAAPPPPAKVSPVFL